MALPTYILLQAKDPHGTPRRFVMVGTVVETIVERGNLPYTHLSVLEHPVQILRGLGNCEWKTDAIEENAFHLRVVRKSKRYSNNRYYEVMVKKTSEYVKTRSGKIHLYTMTQRHTVLPSVLLHISKGEDVHKRWHFVEHQIPAASASAPLPSAPPAPAVASASLPRHVLEGFIDSQISQNQTCPITLEPFTRQTVAYTSCGHLFDKGAIRRELERSGQCPQCRSQLSREDIQTLS